MSLPCLFTEQLLLGQFLSLRLVRSGRLTILFVDRQGVALRRLFFNLGRSSLTRSFYFFSQQPVLFFHLSLKILFFRAMHIGYASKIRSFEPGAHVNNRRPDA